MLIPLSWLKEHVAIQIPFRELAERLSAAGLTVEVWHEQEGDIIFDPEVTPNRPDWLSVMGIAREIAAITGSNIKNQELKIKAEKIKNPLPVLIKPNYAIVPRITSVIIRGVKVKPSPEWLTKRIKQIGLRPINNLVDITNYVLWGYGSLLHVFDYDKIRGHQMTVELSKGGEPFRSLDGISYTLPKDAIVIKDVGRIIDLLPLKGGENTATSSETKNVLLHSVVVDPIITRRTSQTLGLRSDSSALAERGLDPNGTAIAVHKALGLILELAGGEVASEIIDHKEKEFAPWIVEMNHQRLESVLGIKVSPTQVKNTLEGLELKVEGQYKVTVPSFRNDLHIEEDLIEEVGRIYGYNNFPKTLPGSAVPTTPVAYAKDYDFEYQVKQILKGAGYTEIYTYSLVPEKQLLDLGINPEKVLRVDNPISRDYEYLRPNLLGNLLNACKQNLPLGEEVKIYELGKRYSGETIDKVKEEYWIWGAISGDKFPDAKGTVEYLLKEIGAETTIRPATKADDHYWLHPGRTAQIDTIEGEYLGIVGEVHPSLLSKWGIKGRMAVWGLNYDLLERRANKGQIYQSVPKFPGIVEDMALIFPEGMLFVDVLETIQKSSHLVSIVTLVDTHEDSKTLRITYQDKTGNLTDKDVAEIRSKITKKLAELKVRTK